MHAGLARRVAWRLARDQRAIALARKVVAKLVARRLASTARLEQEPHALLSVVDPIFQKTGARHVSISVAELMRFQHPADQILVVIA